MENLPNITENLALNFCNSKLHRNGKIIELIHSIEDLSRWSEIPLDNQDEYNRQLSIFHSFVEEIDSIDELLTFRNELHEQLKQCALDSHELAKLIELIESYLSNQPFRIIFVENWEPLLVPINMGIEGIKTLMYQSLMDLLKSKELYKLSCCANHNCPLIFINHSGRRKWCSMKICGNRNKVERYLKKNE
ncbi:CGNR zinc finger domain-containing protein [Vagococcus fluvialis]|uniref:CGNR zinc finger domain-containing protein n=1 Tax=Vagococcus fluvialis TaxID=2738 RepID=UPI003B5BC806